MSELDSSLIATAMMALCS